MGNFSFNVFNTYLFNTYYVPGIGAAAMKKMGEVSERSNVREQDLQMELTKRFMP